MATVYPSTAGNYSTRTWLNDATGLAYGGPPQVGDTIKLNGVTLTVDQAVTVVEIRKDAGTNASAGGVLSLTGGNTVTANLTAFAANVCSIGTTGANVINGNVQGGTAANASGVTKVSNGTVTINGNVTGGSNSSAHGFNSSSTSAATINGNVTGGTAANGAHNNAGSTITINGNATGNGGYGAANNSATGSVILNGTAIASATTGAAGVANLNASGSVTINAAEYGAQGISPTIGNVRFANLLTATIKITKTDLTTATLSAASGGGFIQQGQGLTGVGNF